MTWRRTLLAVLCIAVVGGLAAFAARAADPDALWKIVHGRCVPDQMEHGDPAPCAAVELTGGERQGFAVLKDIQGATQFLLIPTRRLGGIESAEVIAPDAPNYFAAAWAARGAMDAILQHPVPAEDVGLAINSPQARSQEQLHIHIDCLRADVVAALRQDVAAAQAAGPAWLPLSAPLLGHRYRARWLTETGLAATNPFVVLADEVGAAAMPLQTLVAAGVVAGDGTPGFLLLADQVGSVAGDRAGGEELMDHGCGVLHGGG